MAPIPGFTELVKRPGMECVQDVQERLVSVSGVMLKTLFDLGHVGDSLVKSRCGGRLLVVCAWRRSESRCSSQSLQIQVVVGLQQLQI